MPSNLCVLCVKPTFFTQRTQRTQRGDLLEKSENEITMSTLEKTINEIPADLPAKAKIPILQGFIKLLCSVRLGIVLLILLGLACLIGMLVMQENVDGFAEYYATLTPSQQLVYGKLDFFDIYHSWYFNALLALLSLNIILASIDRFPKTWAIISKPKTTPPIRWLKSLKQSDSFDLNGESQTEIAEKIAEAAKKSGWRKTKITEKGNRTFVFAQSGSWNRMAYQAVHVGLLTIFLGGFLTTQLGQTGQIPLTPGKSSNEMFETVFELNQVKEFKKRIPFDIFCTDIQQKLIKKDGAITTNNTIDWLTRIQIKDGGETHEALVQMNRPFDYRGYRFFQASFTPIGRARNITIRLTSANGGQTQDVTIPRGGAINLADGTNIKFAEFRGNFKIGAENLNEDTSNYPNPGAILHVTPPNAETLAAYAFGEQMANIPAAKNPVAGYTYRLLDFEKVSEQHILAVQYDPGATVVYLGFGLLCLTLVAVFFFSHQRVWAAVEEDSANNFKIIVGGNTNRNQMGFDDKFKKFVKNLRGQSEENQTL
jgi:cytochrome c biogenesis protein